MTKVGISRTTIVAVISICLLIAYVVRWNFVCPSILQNWKSIHKGMPWNDAVKLLFADMPSGNTDSISFTRSLHPNPLLYRNNIFIAVESIKSRSTGAKVVDFVDVRVDDSIGPWYDRFKATLNYYYKTVTLQY